MQCFKGEELSYQSRTPMGLLDTIYQNYMNLKQSKKMKGQRGNMTEFEFFNSPVNQIAENQPMVNFTREKSKLEKKGLLWLS